ncbi:hypothetical protein CB1_000363005 [Camelus ferus]|nr:hypothetical protein CB1_000363005 [Camelus ferus]
MQGPERRQVEGQGQLWALLLLPASGPPEVRDPVPDFLERPRLGLAPGRHLRPGPGVRAWGAVPQGPLAEAVVELGRGSLYGPGAQADPEGQRSNVAQCLESALGSVAPHLSLKPCLQWNA